MQEKAVSDGAKRVALHPEGVDRNKISRMSSSVNVNVALHPEGVDRNNIIDQTRHLRSVVALHPEGVDRNPKLVPAPEYGEMSPSTRRAWIEMCLQCFVC